jgi:hypothetical protein
VEVSRADKRYLVSCKTPEVSTQPVVAASCEVHGEHLVLLNSKGSLADMFPLETVERKVRLLSRLVSDFDQIADLESLNLCSKQLAHVLRTLSAHPKQADLQLGRLFLEARE